MQGTRMNSVRIPYWRAATALICAFVLLLVSAAAPLHGHADPSQHACTLCQFDNSPADIEASSPLLTPPSPIAAVAQASVSAPDTPLVTTASGRGPPSRA
jgi:hypothetical protein